jgi:hypothetical protein
MEHAGSVHSSIYRDRVRIKKDCKKQENRAVLLTYNKLSYAAQNCVLNYKKREKIAIL